jgi:hypothetical protein
MKTKQYTISMLLLTIVLLNATACKKERICVCKSTFYPEDKAVNYGKMRKRKAQNQCNSAQGAYERSTLSFGWDCQLK